MAFNMKRPIIKGTPFHKALIAKAKSESIVAQTKTQADSALVGAATSLGESYIPAAIDFSIDQKAIKIPESKEDNGDREKPETEKQKQKRINKRRKQKIDDRRLGKKEGNQKIYDNLTKRKNSRGLTEQEQEALDKASKELGIKKIKENTKNTINTKKTKENTEKTVKVKKEKGKNIFEKGYKSIKDFIKDKKQKKLEERLIKAEEGPDSDYDFSELDKEPGLDTKKTEKYKSPEAGTKESEELLSRTGASRNKALQEAAKKHNVKVEDLEAKHIGPKNKPLTKEEIQKYGKNYVRPSDLAKRQFYPKQGSVGGKDKTQWSDEKGRFLIPSGGYSDEEILQMSSEDKAVYEKEMNTRAQKAVDEANELKPTQNNIKEEDLSDMYQMIQGGDIALNKETNSYEYTDVYKKTQANIASKNNTKVKPVVGEEGQNTATTRTREQKENDKVYNDFRTSDYKKRKMIEGGYTPIQSKSPMEMRDDRIYRNAKADGPVRRNMIKGGYTPR